MHAFVRANEQLRTSHAGIFQSAKAADRYDDIRQPWRLRIGGDYPDARWPAKSEAASPALLPAAEGKPVDGESFDSDPGQRDQDRCRMSNHACCEPRSLRQK
jgi:hypothetical protein